MCNRSIVLLVIQWVVRSRIHQISGILQRRQLSLPLVGKLGFQQDDASRWVCNQLDWPGSQSGAWIQLHEARLTWKHTWLQRALSMLAMSAMSSTNTNLRNLRLFIDPNNRTQQGGNPPFASAFDTGKSTPQTSPAISHRKQQLVGKPQSGATVITVPCGAPGCVRR